MGNELEGGVAVDVAIVGYGRAATTALALRIAAAKSSGHALDPVTVVVPSNAAGLSARRLLATGDAGTGLKPVNLANVSFVTPFRLAELLGSSSVGDRRPLTNPVLAAAVRATLSAGPGIFGAVARHEATQSAVVALYAELSRATPETRSRIAAGSHRGAEVVRVVEETAARLTGFFAEDDLAVAAAHRLRADPAAAKQLGTFLWHLPGRLTPAMSGLLEVALEQADPSAAVILALTGAPEADAAVLDTVRDAGVAVADQAVAEAAIERPTTTHMVSVSDADEEVRHVVRELVQLVTDGTPLDRIAIFRPTPGSYARTLTEQLDGAGVPHNGPGTARLADSVAGRTLRAALALPANGWKRGDVLALITQAPVRLDGARTPVREWDGISRRAGVVGGLDDWRIKLAAHRATVQSALDELESLETSERGALERALARTAQLSAFVNALAVLVSAVEDAATWADRAAAAHVLVQKLLRPEQRRVQWPAHEISAAHGVDQALARLGTLDDLEPSPTRETFELSVAAELGATSGRVGRFGHGVLVAPLGSAVGHDLDAVFLLGMAEGTCPALRRDDALLPDTDRMMAERGELLTQAERLRTQHRNYLAALAAGGKRRTLLFPRGDLRGRRERLPSRWLLDSASEAAGERVFSSSFAELPPDIVQVVKSYKEGVTNAGVHGSTADRDVAELLASPDPLASGLLLAGDLGRGLAARTARSGAEFTEWDGNLAGQPFPSPATGVPLSPSRLETWAACPFKYFLANVLRLREREDPEHVTEISPAAKGTLVHLVLERFITEVLGRPEGAPAPNKPWTRADRARVRELAEDEFIAEEARGTTGRPLTWRRAQADILADLETFLTKDDEHRRSNDVRPARAEMAFGMGQEEPLTIELPGGRLLTFRGQADRVDAREDGRLVVLDYKTGKGDAYQHLEEDPVQAGQNLQLGIYAEAAKAQLGSDQVEAYYWMISSRGSFKRHGYLWSEDKRSRFLDVTEAIVDGIESGMFAAQPGEYSTFWGTHDGCSFCDFDRICPRDRDDHQRAMADAPELTVLQRLQLRAEEL